MPLQDIKFKKRIPNIIIGLIFGLLAIYLSPCFWSYLFYILSALSFIFTDQVIRTFIINTETGHFSVKDFDVEMEVRDKDGNLKNKII